MMRLKGYWQRYKWTGLAVLSALFAFNLTAYLFAEVVWFEEVGYRQTLTLRLQTQTLLGLGGSFLTAGFLIGNLYLAKRLKHSLPNALAKQPRLDRGGMKSAQADRRSGLRLRSLLPLVLTLSAIAGLMLLHYAQLALEFWQANLSLTDISPQVPPRFQPQSLGNLLVQLPQHPWQLGILLALIVVVLLNAQACLTAIATVVSLGFGISLAGHWSRVLQFFHPAPFNRTDPLFSLDISTYTFVLPVLELLGFWLVGITIYGVVAVTLVYLLSGDSISQGCFPGFSQKQQRHLYGLASLLMLVVAFSYLLACFELLYSTTGVVYGASYTDVSVTLPANIALGIGSFILATLLIGRTIYWRRTKWLYPRRLLIGVGGYLIFAAATGIVLPQLVQSLVVQPTELERERPYIEHNIAFTRRAFDLNNIEVRTFDPEGSLTPADLERNSTTISNIRLWDTRPLLATNRQLQQIRLYYRFPDADIDRYLLQARSEAGEPIKATRSQQVIIAPRELDYSAVPDQAQTWINEHLIYTHGYGFTLSPVNTAGPGGLPDYFVKDIGVETETKGSSTLDLSSEIIRNSIPIGQPRIYYGEIADTYVMTATKVKELDYPSGNDNVYNTYDGSGGIQIGSFWRKLLFATYLRDWQMLLTRNFIPETKVLFRRNIRDRIRAIAPFLRYDKEAYLVVANTNLRKTSEGLQEIKAEEDSASSPNYLYWVIDAYTTSDRYPYSDPGEESFNYIRNSVKVVVDAYNGSIDFYIADPRDPIVQVWNTVFPGMFKPLDEMPLSLRSHIRYPTDLFSIQSERLLTYHMTDPQVFYNREDQWQVPNEIYGNEPRPVEPYYLIMRLPTEAKEEFILLHPFTPTSRNNLIAWLAGRSDGNNYGKLLLYQFPKQRLIYGPEQIEARINQDPVISQRISLWNRQGSRAVQGNLLVIPIEQSLLYVEPVYLEAERNSLPTLARVIVAYENQISMAPSLDTTLEAIFKPGSANGEAILRQVDSELLLEEGLAPPPGTESESPASSTDPLLTPPSP